MKKDKEKKLENPKEQNYRDEMDELARIFKEELDKAVADAEDDSDFDDIEKVDVEGYNPKEVSIEEEEKETKKSKKKEKVHYSEEELCDCCGERPRGTKKNPNSIFCEECEAILEKYPYDWKGIFTAIVMFGFMLYSLIMLIGETPIFANAVRGDQALKDGKVYTAIYKYEMAFTHLANNDDMELAKEYKGLFAKHIMAEYRANAISIVWTEADSFFTEKDLKMPWFKDVREAFEDTESLSISMSAVDNIHLKDYQTATSKDIAKDYDKIMATLNSLSGKKIYEKGGVYHDETETDYTPDGSETVYVYDETILNLYKYSVSFASEKSPEIIAGHLEKVIQGSPAMGDFARTNLAVAYIKLGKYAEAEKLANELRENNCETNYYYYITSMLYRYRDKNYDEAVKTCVNGLVMLSKLDDGANIICVEGAHLSMQKTLAYIMQKDYKNAYDSANECLGYEVSYLMNVNGYDEETALGYAKQEYKDLVIMLAIMTNDTEAIEAYDKSVADLGEDAIVHEHITKFRNGEITLEEIVMTGRYDWQ